MPLLDLVKLPDPVLQLDLAPQLVPHLVKPLAQAPHLDLVKLHLDLEQLLVVHPHLRHNLCQHLRQPASQSQLLHLLVGALLAEALVLTRSNLFTNNGDVILMQ